MTRHQDFQADLVEVHRVAETRYMPLCFLDIGKVERADQPFIGRDSFAESTAEAASCSFARVVSTVGSVLIWRLALGIAPIQRNPKSQQRANHA